MSIGEVVGCLLVLGWLLGVGLLAHAVLGWLAEDDFISLAMQIAPERVAILMAMTVVSWPLSIPALAVMKLMKETGR